MDGEKFKSLEVKEQVKYINELLKQGDTVDNIRMTLGIGKNYIGKTFKANGYIKELPYPNKLGLWLNAIKCFLLYGATPSDWKFYEMYKYNHRENKEIITNRKSNELDRLFNPREYAQDFDDNIYEYAMQISSIYT